VEVRGFKARGCRNVCTKAVHREGKGGLPKEEGWGKIGEEERVGGNGGEVKHTVWAEAHQVIYLKVFDKRKSDNESMRCGMKSCAWKYCRKPVQVSAVYRGQSKPK